MRRFYHAIRVQFLALLIACVAGLFVLAGVAIAAPPSPSASASAAPKQLASTDVRVREKTIVTLRADRGGRTASERATAANSAIASLLEHPDELTDTRFEETQGTAVVYVGKTPVLTLGPEDVDATGEASLAVLAAQVTTRLSDAVSGERKRSAIATTVFSFSLLVFSALLAFLLLGRVTDLASRLRARVIDDPERVGALRLGKVEFLSAGAIRGSLTIAVTLGYRLVQIAIGYAWLIFGLSLFDATRGYTERLTGAVGKPLYGLASRIGGALPLVIVAVIAVVAVLILVRFVGLFFESIAHGDTRIGWVSRDLARPTSTLIRFGIVVVAFVLASPMITGESDGALSRAGLAALFAIALSATPLLASAAVGVIVVFGRRLKKGEQVELGGRAGRVVDVTLFDVHLEDATMSHVSVPHLLGLVHPTRIHRHAPLTTLDVVVDPTAPQDEVEKALFDAARLQSSRGHVELVYLDAAGAHWRVTSAAMRHHVSLAKVVQDALAKLGAGLGRGRTSPPASVLVVPAPAPTAAPAQGVDET